MTSKGSRVIDTKRLAELRHLANEQNEFRAHTVNSLLDTIDALLRVAEAAEYLIFCNKTSTEKHCSQCARKIDEALQALRGLTK